MKAQREAVLAGIAEASGRGFCAIACVTARELREVLRRPVPEKLCGFFEVCGEPAPVFRHVLLPSFRYHLSGLLTAKLSDLLSLEMHALGHADYAGAAHLWLLFHLGWSYRYGSGVTPYLALRYSVTAPSVLRLKTLRAAANENGSVVA
jgi:hypothetical protein